MTFGMQETLVKRNNTTNTQFHTIHTQFITALIKRIMKKKVCNRFVLSLVFNNNIVFFLRITAL